MKGKRIVGVCWLLACWMALRAGGMSDSTSILRNGWFTYAPYGKSLLSDVHPNFVRFEMVGNTNHQAYDFTHSDKGFRLSTQGCFGMDLPLWNGNFGADKRFGLSFTLSASAYLWMDLFESQTSPVLNTDYRIGMPTHTFIHRLNRKFLKNYSIAWSPFKHESTHVGDEIQIQRVEAYFQYQYQTPTLRHGFQGIVSAEIRNRVVYGYDLTAKEDDEDSGSSDYRRFTYNLFLGMRYNIPGYDGYFSRFALGVRLYHGNCPFGHFRSIDNFSQVGVAFVFQ